MRLWSCTRVSVEIEQRSDNDTALASDARHRVDIFTATSTVGDTVTHFEYYPNWPSSVDKAVLDVVP